MQFPPKNDGKRLSTQLTNYNSGDWSEGHKYKAGEPETGQIQSGKQTGENYEHVDSFTDNRCLT